MAYTPFPSISSQDAEENEWWLRREISLIQNLLKEEGEAFREGVKRGAFEKVRRGRYRAA